MFTKQVLVAILLSAHILVQVLSDELITESPESLDSDSSNSQTETLNELGYRLMTQLVEHNNSTNIVMSPVGITVLLSMALLGSTGSTYDELADILGFSRDILENRMRHEKFGNLLQSLNDTCSKTMLADAVFVDQGSRLRDAYRGYLARVYGAEARRVRFTDGGEARKAINEWVKTHTADEIDNFLSDNLPPSTKVVLLNALYFKGQWAQPFNPEFTTKMVFQAPEKKVIADFMLNTGKFGYISSKEDGIHMVALPYKDNITTMYALKPRHSKRLNILKVLKNLNYTKIDKLITRMKDQNCMVRFPKMNIESILNLEKYIKLEGAEAMFKPGEANFALMVEAADKVVNESDMDLITRMQAGNQVSEDLKVLLDKLANPGIHVDSIIQKVKINIDEYGTEAIAATAGILARTAEMFYADSPFLMFIRNEKTKLITFSAVIFDPTDK